MTASRNFQEPWLTVTDYPENLEREARLEMPPDHPLAGIKLRAIAQHRLCDDVLFELEGTPKPLAVVHLTWRGEPEVDSRLPETRFFESFDDWVDRCMIPDRASFLPEANQRA